MARIRTIKPEFPHSESMGNVSRDARLTFIQLWTLADDAGRLRGNSRMLASLLFPYDDDAKDLIEGWLTELERENCVQRYSIEGASYLQVCNWLKHQKIDKPSPSKLPRFDEASRIVAKAREASSGDLDLDLDVDLDLDREGKGEGSTRTRARVEPNVPRGSGTIDMGNFLTTISPTAAYESLLEDWRRDVPDCNPSAFEKWIVTVESKGRPMNAAMRLGQAKQLAGNGDFAEQLEVVEYCIAQGYKSLIPLRDVRARTRGMTREKPKDAPKRTWRPPPDETGAKAC